MQNESEIRRYFPNFHNIGMDNVSHWLHAQQPDRVIEILLNFLVRLWVGRGFWGGGNALGQKIAEADRLMLHIEDNSYSDTGE